MCAILAANGLYIYLLLLTSLDGMLDARSRCDAGEGKNKSACFVLLCGPQEFAKRRRPFAGFLSGLFDHIQLDSV